VVLVCYYSGYRLTHYTGESCVVKQWDCERQRFRKSYPGYFEANGYLDSLSERLQKCFREYMSKGIIPTPTLLKDALTPESSVPASKSSPDTIELYNEFLASLRVRGNKSVSLKHYKKALHHFQGFISEGTPVRVDAFTESVYCRFIEYMMLKRDYHPNTLGNITKYLKAFFKWCRDVKGIALHPQHAPMPKIWVQPEKVHLTWDELMALYLTPLSDRLSKVRDAFVFACVTGLRHSDLSKLTWDQVHERDGYKVLSLVPQKTNNTKSARVKRIEIPLAPIALALLERYKGDHLKALPVLTNQRMNDYIKEACQLTGIDTPVETVVYRNLEATTVFVSKYELITCHVARHTFATLSLQKGMPIEILQKLLGHSDLKTTLIYARVVDDWKNRVMLDVWSSVSVKRSEN
jgi:integrase/recombinase XerD